MLDRICLTRNIQLLDKAYQGLIETPTAVEKIALVHGPSGLGKTTAMNRLIFRYGGINLRATPAWSPNVMLRKILVELGKDTRHRNQDMLDAIQESLQLNRRTIFIDEADMIFECRDVGRLLETLRTVYDNSHAPIVLVGMDMIAKKISRWPQLNRRITQDVEFEPLDRQDARALADECCEVKIADDILWDLHQASGGNCGYMVNGLSRIEARAKSYRWDIVTLAQWKERQCGEYFLDRRR